MGWESKVTNQMLSYLWLFKNTSHSWMALITLLLLFSSYLLFGFGFFSFLYSFLVVLLSTVLFSVSKNKSVQVDDHKLEEEKIQSCFSEEESSDQRENIAPTPREAKELVQEEVKMDGTVPNYLTTTSSPDLLSESECQEQLSTSEDSEVDWPFQYDVDHHIQDCSDGSISDEESLIEIALPSGHYVAHEQPKYNNCSMQQKKTLFCQQSLMEFLSEFNEVNEEENLIEIDISMGSAIKYSSRFEIKA